MSDTPENTQASKGIGDKASMAIAHIKTRWKSSMAAIAMILGVWFFIFANPSLTFSILTFRPVAFEKIISASDVVNDSCGPEWDGPANRCKFYSVRTSVGDNTQEFANIDVNMRFMGINWGKVFIKGEAGSDQTKFQKFQQDNGAGWMWVTWIRVQAVDWYPLTLSSPRAMDEMQADGNMVNNGSYDFWKYAIWAVKAAAVAVLALAFHVAFKLSRFGSYGWKVLLFPITALIYVVIRLPYRGYKLYRQSKSA